MIYDELYITEFLNACTPLYKDIEEDIFNTYKILHDYSKDYINIEMDTPHAYTTCDDDYKEFIDKYINIYKATYKDCIEEKKKNYDCKKIFSLFENKSYSVLTSFTCKKGKPQYSVIETEAEDVDHRPSSSDVRLLGRIYSPKAHPDTDRRPRYEAPSAPYSNPGLTTQYESYDSLSLPKEDATGGSSSKTIASSVVPVLGVSSISLLLYKVTPVGGFINKLLGRNRNMYNPIEDMDAFNPYSDEMHPRGRRMNISYHRL
ncbi:Plasmodium vivax Vir protein, putative [Plasmodium vivax]|uniref:Vir protein, putative n=1 Tax=Plasmodium vivax TaxID=5855 RepID=A0A1G4EF38_PLAVI|nr:Plasmodium vivax Vir protein, putative [Plasmodium vivax]